MILFFIGTVAEELIAPIFSHCNIFSFHEHCILPKILWIHFQIGWKNTLKKRRWCCLVVKTSICIMLSDAKKNPNFFDNLSIWGMAQCWRLPNQRFWKSQNCKNISRNTTNTKQSLLNNRMFNWNLCQKFTRKSEKEISAKSFVA